MSTYNKCFHGEIRIFSWDIYIVLDESGYMYHLSFSYFSLKTCCGYSLEEPQLGTSNEFQRQ